MTNQELLVAAAAACLPEHTWEQTECLGGIIGSRLSEGKTLYKLWNPLNNLSARYLMVQTLKMNVNWKHQCVSGMSKRGQLITRAWGPKKDHEDEGMAILEVAALMHLL